MQSQQVLKQYFGYDKFRPMQAEIIQNVLEKKDCLVLMPTGGGKSITFQIPALMSDGITIVVSPLISLMKDQVESLIANGISAAYYNSSQTMSQLKTTENKILYNKIKLLYVSPEKLVSKSFYYTLKNIKLNLFAIDEAHCISQWGHDFRPEYTKLKFLKKYFSKIPIIALTATADKITARDIIKQLCLNKPKQFIASFDRPNLSLTVVPGQKRIQKIIYFIKQRLGQSGIIYCLSRKSTESVARSLINSGINASYYHAGLPSRKRSEIQEEFIKDNMQITCATIAFGMGIDKSNIRWVIHYNMPQNIENYYQQIGRAGRDGMNSDTLMFYSFSDVIVYRKFIEEGANIEIEKAKLKRIQEYAEAQTCRRKILLSYFGEHLEDNCNNCDVCKNPPAQFDGTVIAQKALSAIYRLKEKVGINMLIDVLRGSQRNDIIRQGYNKIKTYAAGKNISFADWQQLILQLLNQGFIEIAYDRNHVLQLTDASKDVLFNKRKVSLVKTSEQERIKDIRKKKSKKTISRKQQLYNELFNKLISLRKKMADYYKIPAYAIFTDSVLDDMTKYRPTNETELSNISGVSEYKRKKYGKYFCREVLKFLKENLEDSSRLKGSTHVITYALFEEGKSIEEIAKIRGLKITTIYSHIANSYSNGKNIDINRIMPDNEMSRIKLAIKSMGTKEGLKILYDYMNGEISYGKIRFGIEYYKKNKK